MSRHTALGCWQQGHHLSLISLQRLGRRHESTTTRLAGKRSGVVGCRAIASGHTPARQIANGSRNSEHWQSAQHCADCGCSPHFLQLRCVFLHVCVLARRRSSHYHSPLLLPTSDAPTLFRATRHAATAPTRRGMPTPKPQRVGGRACRRGAWCYL